MNVLRKYRHYACLVICGVAVVISSCKKESDSENPATPALSKKTQLLTSSKWIVQSITVNPPYDFGFGPVSDLYGPAPTCFKDDFFTYKTNGDRVHDQGASKCNASDPQTSTKKWKFLDNETKLVDGSDTANIVTLTSAQLVITTQSVDQGTTYTYTTTYHH